MSFYINYNISNNVLLTLLWSELLYVFNLFNLYFKNKCMYFPWFFFILFFLGNVISISSVWIITPPS
ncbi:uncharacterized protein BX663DRAFT_503256, partial [Cokeromyces recurvatus]|uniref:uncharacterized protein n=1 Tax=Cokeromyces recurvatus TaxID=90255 RepID=UPI00221EEF19